MSSSSQIKHYTAFIYERLDSQGRGLSIYDVEIFTKCAEPDPNRGTIYRQRVYTARVETFFAVSLNALTSYMHWKFRHCQPSDAVRSRGVFTRIDHSLEWIKSIIDTEFDYHIGMRNCLLPVYQNRLYQYRNSEFSSF